MDTIGNRIAQIIAHEGLKKVQFAAKLGIHQSYVTQLIKGKNPPSEALVKLICREFNVNEAWLVTGEGEPYRKPDAVPFADYAKERRMTEFEAQFVRTWLELPEDVREMLARHFQERMGIGKPKPDAAPAPAPAEPRKTREEEADEVTARIREQILNGGEKVSESGTPPAGAGIA